MGSKEVVEAICKASLLENSLTKKTGKGVIKDALEETKWGGEKPEPIIFYGSSYHVIHLQDKPVTLESFNSFDPNVRATFGKFTLTFFCKNDWRVRKGRRFVIDQDLIRARIFFYNSKELARIAKKVPEVAWIVRNSTLTDELLDLATQHTGIPFVFTVDWPRYAKKIKEQAELENIDIDERPYVTYNATRDVYDKYKDKYISERKNINDYNAAIGDLYNHTLEDYEDGETEQ